MRPWLWILPAFLIVAFGQPVHSVALSLVASLCGYALFWKGMRLLPKTGHRFLLSWVFFTVVQCIQLSWMTSDRYQGAYIWVVWFILCLLMGGQFALLSLLLRGNRPLHWAQMLAVPALWCISEWARLYFISGFTWNPVGIALSGTLWARQLAALIGVYGLSFWVMLINVCMLRLLEEPLSLRRIAPATAVALFPFAFGAAHIAYHTSGIHDGEEPFRAILVQSGMSPTDRSGMVERDKMIHPLEQWKRLLALVGTYRDKEVDVVLFPECVVPFEANQIAYEYGWAKRMLAESLGAHFPVLTLDTPLGAEVHRYDQGKVWAVSNSFFCQTLAEALDADIVVGMDDSDEEGSYNSALRYTPGGNGKFDRYAKQILLPFSEIIPGGEWARYLASLYGIKCSFTPGKEVGVFPGKIPMGISVCYEETFTPIIWAQKRAGAEILLNVTNDGWFPNSSLPPQHFHHGRLRAVENGIPLLRACHTGITAAVDSLGRTVGHLGEQEDFAGALYVEVPRYHHTTLYSLVGDGLPVGASLFFFLFYLAYPRPPRE
ncbi:MAG: apolipoprotein N-acyltransferase [Parachlamydiales bacterium]